MATRSRIVLFIPSLQDSHDPEPAFIALS
ncbi:hypothetical protein RHECNPAF_280032 [Rhizobium etli CNPAF512]|nr:hypothetical protein RHECNPAF_280032 [Rhizobium etli CNPAF512]